MDKKTLRKQVRDKLRSLTMEQYEEKSKKIAEQLFQLQEWKKANCIGITISIFPEVNTYPIIEKAWEQGKNVAAVKCVPETRGLEFYQINDFTQVEKGFYGLYEPVVEMTIKVDPKDIQLVIVPGLAFTNEGKRLGVGGGYYDRFLPMYKGKTVSLAFDEQLLEDIPVEPHDWYVQKVVGERNVYHCE